MSSNASQRETLKLPWSLLRAGGRHGLSDNEVRDPIGLAVLALNKIASSDLLDRLGIRKASERGVYRVTSAGFRTAGNVGRTFARAGKATRGNRVPSAKNTGLFDLTPGEDEQMLADVVGEFSEEMVRPAAADANEACAAPDDLLKASLEIGLPILGVPEDLGGIATERSAVAGALVHEALAQGRHGTGRRAAVPGRRRHRDLAVGHRGAAVHLPAGLHRRRGPRRHARPGRADRALRPGDPGDHCRPRGRRLRAQRREVRSGARRRGRAVRRGCRARGQAAAVPRRVEGRRHHHRVRPVDGAAGRQPVAPVLKDVAVEQIALLGDDADYLDCVRYSRLAWCALAVGTAQAVLDYVTPYVKEREAFGEPIAHRQSVAFMVANIAIELQGMRLVTWKAAGRVAQGKPAEREIALARRLCAERGMQIGLDGVQLLGGHGFVKEHPVERWYRDLRAIGLMEGAVLV